MHDDDDESERNRDRERDVRVECYVSRRIRYAAFMHNTHVVLVQIYTFYFETSEKFSCSKQQQQQQ